MDLGLNARGPLEEAPTHERDQTTQNTVSQRKKKSMPLSRAAFVSFQSPQVYSLQRQCTRSPCYLRRKSFHFGDLICSAFDLLCSTNQRKHIAIPKQLVEKNMFDVCSVLDFEMQIVRKNSHARTACKTKGIFNTFKHLDATIHVRCTRLVQEWKLKMSTCSATQTR